MNWLGALLVVAASYFCGTALARDEGDRLKTLDSLILLLKYMRRRINAERIPLFEIFSGFDDEFLEDNGFLPILRSHRNGMPILWSEAVSKLPTDEETKRELTHFGQSLGGLPMEEQILRLDACVSFLSDSRKSLLSNLPAKQKSIKTVCLLLGVMAAIILL